MQQFKSILQFELYTYIKAKSYIIFTSILIVIMGLILFSPRYLPLFIGEDNSLFGGSSEPEPGIEDTNTDPDLDNEDTSIDYDESIAISSSLDDYSDLLLYLQQNLAMYGFELVETNCTAEEISDLVANEDYEKAIFVNSLTSYDLIVNETSLYDSTYNDIYNLFSEYNKLSALSQIVPEGTDINEILYPTIEQNFVELGINQMDNFMYTYLLIFILYLAVIIYGQYVITSIVTEKTSRAMEVLITSAKPNTFIMAKIMGAGLAGLIQLGCILISAFIFYNVNASFWADIDIVNSIFNIPSSLIVYMLIFFILGYFIYAFMFGAIGSLASRMEDVSSLMTPVMLLFIVAFYITIIGLSSGNVNSTLMVVASYIPFTSPMAMFTRIAMTEVALYEVAISVAILIVSTFVIGFAAAKIYRMGVLFYGNKPKFKEICKMLISKD